MHIYIYYVHTHVLYYISLSYVPWSSDIFSPTKRDETRPGGSHSSVLPSFRGRWLVSLEWFTHRKTMGKPWEHGDLTNKNGLSMG